ncbi:MAG TPA: hypothetical protein VEZ90_01800 [Blastocatellia bacterium]|nr:hypothetical protein [Blastocatellia bacterium]
MKKLIISAIMLVALAGTSVFAAQGNKKTTTKTKPAATSNKMTGSSTGKTTHRRHHRRHHKASTGSTGNKMSKAPKTSKTKNTKM